jgi:hypothetical protein
VQLGKIAVERPQVAALDEHVGGSAEHDGAEAVPLGLEQEIARGRELVGELGEHGFYGGGKRRLPERNVDPGALSMSARRSNIPSC